LIFPRNTAILKQRARALCATTLVAAFGLLAADSAAAAPVAHDFSQDLPPVERASDALHKSVEHEAYKSSVLEAPQRFDFAGLGGGELRHYELRGRKAGGEWTDWTETANGDPVWFGGMDELQVRTHEWKPSGRIHYVAVSTPEPTSTVAAKGGGNMPDVVTRREWGANRSDGGCEPRQNAEYGRVKAAAVHHTVSAVNYSEAQAPGLVLGICRFHRNSNGWDDIGYNALVDRFGNIYAGRDGGLSRAVIGAHTQGYNAQTTGVAVIGTHTSTPASKSAISGVARWLAWKLPEHGLGARGTARLVSAGGDANRYPQGETVKTRRIMGHRRTGFTECPGNALNNQLSQIRDKTQRRIDGGGGGSGDGDGSGGGGIGS
jgi:hypothetical protein